MNLDGLSPRGFISLLLHGPKITDVLATALRLGVLGELDRGPVTLDALVARTGAVPLRLYKFLDVLESAGLVRRNESSDRLGDATFVSTAPLEGATEAVLGERSIEKDRERWPWKSIHGRLDETLRGRTSIGRDEFSWPPETDAQAAAFEESMAAGVPPILETFRARHDALFPRGARVLDVGGGDGALAEGLLAERDDITVDVFNLPAIEPLVRTRRERLGANAARLGFVGGDFLEGPLRGGYDVISFVRVLHDWPSDVARMLLSKAHDALPVGGKLIVCEEFRAPEKLAIQLFWTYFLIGVDSCVSRLREVEWYEERLTQLGFVDIRVHRGGPFEILEAKRADGAGPTARP